MAKSAAMLLSVLFFVSFCGKGFHFLDKNKQSVNNIQIGGSVQGLNSNSRLNITKNNTEELTVDKNGPFQFNDPVSYGHFYNVTVSSHPDGQTCTVLNGSGVAVGGSQVNNISIQCVAGNFPQLGVAIAKMSYGSGNGYDFGSVALNGQSEKEIVVEIRNNGPGSALELDTSQLTFTGDNPDAFSITTLPFFLSNPIQAGDELPLTIQFTADSPGVYSAILRIPCNDPNQPEFLLEFFGTVTDDPQPEIQVLSGVHNIMSGDTFPLPQAVTGKANNYLLQIKNGGLAQLNDGGGSLNVTALTAAPEFTLATPTVPSLESDDTTNLSFSLNPPVPGSYSETYQITSNDPDEGSFLVTVLIDAVNPGLGQVAYSSAPAVFYGDSATLDLGTIATGSADKVVGFFVVNNGGLPFSITGAPVITGSESAAFTISDFTFPRELAPGESYGFTITLSAIFAGDMNAQLAIPVDEAYQPDNELNFNLAAYAGGIVTRLAIDAAGDTLTSIENDLSPGTFDGIADGALMFAADRFGNQAEAITFVPTTVAAELGNIEIDGVTGNATDLPSTTWSAWVQPVTVTGNDQMIISADESGDQNRRGIFIFGNTYYVGLGSSTYDTTVPVDWGSWQHIAVTYTASDAFFYKNGERYTLGAQDVGSQTSSGNIRVGALKSGGSFLYPFAGNMDGVEVANTALSDAEIRLAALRSPSGVANYFPLNSSDGYSDLAGGDDGALAGGTPAFSPNHLGIAGGAALFTTADSLQFNSAAAAFSAAAGSISFWFSPSGVGAGEQIFSAGIAGTLDLGWAGQTLTLNHSVAGSETIASNLETGMWYKVTVTWAAGGELKAYLAGTESATMSFTSAPSSGTFILGNFDGSVSELVFYDNELSASEVATTDGALYHDLVHYYPLGNDSGDYGSAGANLGAGTTASIGIDGLADTASLFDGNDQFTGSDEDYGNSVTISVWVRFANTRTTYGGTDRELIVAKGNDPVVGAAPDEFFLYLNRDALNNVLACEVSDGAGGYATATVDGFSSRFHEDVWYFVACSYREGRMRLYVNGEIADEINPTVTALNDSTSILRLGRVPGPPQNYDGYMDEVRLHRRELSAMEVGRLFALHTGNHLVQYPGDTVADNSGNGLDLTLNGTSITGSGGFQNSAHFDFDGIDDSMDSSSASILDNLRAVSFAGWMRISDTNLSVAPPSGILAINGDTLNDATDLAWQITWTPDSAPGGRLALTKSDGGALGTLQEDFFADQVQAGEWFYLAGAVTEDDMQLFINGQPRTFSTASGVFAGHNAGIRFGGIGATNNWGGGMDELIVRNRPLYSHELYPPAAGFNPRSVPGIVLWLSAGQNSYTGGTPAGNGDDVDEWRSKAGIPLNSAPHQFQVGPNEPDMVTSGIGGLPALDFDGTESLGNNTGNIFGAAATSEVTVCLVAYATAGTYLSFDNGSYDFSFASNQVVVDDGTNSVVLAGLTQDTTARAYCMRLFKDSATGYTVELATNGLFSSNTATLNDNGFETYSDFYIGGLSSSSSADLVGRIAEVIVYDRALNSEQITELSCWLAGNYSITAPSCP